MRGNTLILLLFISTLMQVKSPATAQDKEKPVLGDSAGDPLPAGAIVRLGTTRLRHSSQVLNAAFSADGKMLASFGGDNTLRLWDTSDGKETQHVLLKALFAISSFSPAVAFSADGKTVAVSSSRQIALCDVGKAEPRLLPESADFFTGIAFAPNSKLLAAFGSANTVSLIDPATGKEVRKLKGHDKSILTVTFSADSKTVVTSSADRTCRIWTLDGGDREPRIQSDDVPAFMLALSPDGKWLARWDEDGSIRVRDFVSGKEQTLIKASGPLFFLHSQQSAMVFMPDGTLRALHEGREVLQWQPNKGWERRFVESRFGDTAVGRMAPDGRSAAIWAWDYGPSMQLVSLDTGKEKEMAAGHVRGVNGVLAQPGGRLVASLSSDNSIRLWDPTTSREQRRWQLEGVWHPAIFTPDGKAVAFGDHDTKDFVRVCEIRSGKQLRRFDTDTPQKLAVSGNGKLLLVADFKRVEVWDFDKGERLRELDGVPETSLPVLKTSGDGPWLSYTVHSLHVTPDGKLAAAAFTRAGGESSVYLWNTANGKLVADWPGRKSLQDPIEFSPDGQVLAATTSSRESGREVVFWSLADQKVVKRFPIADVACHAIAFSRDGKLLALGGYYRSIVQVYEIASGKEIANFQAHRGPVSLTFSDDCATLITGSDDTTLLIWDLNSKELRRKN